MKYEVTDQRLPCVFFALLISVEWTKLGDVFTSGEDFLTEKYISDENVSHDWAKPYFHTWKLCCVSFRHVIACF